MGRHVLVTGAGSGIGEAIAERFAGEGCSVTLAARGAGGVARVAAVLAARGCACRALQGDIAAAEDVARIVREAQAAFGPIDVLVNNAGIYPSGPIVDFSEEDYERVMNVNLRGAFLATRTVLREMMRRKSGWIVNVSSVDGKTPGHENAVYSASKAALISFTQSAAREAAPFGVLVNAVAPGWVGTEKVTAGERWKKAVGDIPLGRLARPAEVAGAVSFLCSPDASYIAGETLNVNGGMYMD